MTLAELDADTWRTPAVIWQGRNRWGVLVDLRTVEEGSNDLVLHAYFDETEAGLFEFEIFSIYAP